MFLRFLYFITDFGDPAVVLPAAAILFLWLTVVVAPAVALRWAAAVLGCALATIALCAALILTMPADFSLRVPSGHGSGSVLVYGAYGVLLARGRPRRIAIPIAVLCGFLIAGILVSRASLPHGHSIAEVVAGAIIGAACLVGFAFSYRRQAAAPPPYAAAATALVVVVAIHGARLEIWPVVRAIALYLRSAAAGIA